MKKLTVFDLDETLVHGDSSLAWRKFLQDQGIITDPDFTRKDNEMMRQYAEGTLNIYEYLAFSLEPIANMPVSDVNQLVKTCITERVLPTAFVEGKALLKTLTAQQPDDILIISATVSFIVKPIAAALGVKHAIGIDMVTKNHGGYDSYTTSVDGTPSFREGKVTRLQNWLTEHGRAYDHIAFYTDSINDLPLCEFADEVFTVNPCPQLRPIAEQRGWGILDWTVA